MDTLFFIGMITDQFAASLSRTLRLFPSLTALYLDQGRIGDVGLSAMAGAISCGALPSLAKRSLRSSPHGPDGFRALGVAVAGARAGDPPRWPKLERLTLKLC